MKIAFVGDKLAGDNLVSGRLLMISAALVAVGLLLTTPNAYSAENPLQQFMTQPKTATIVSVDMPWDPGDVVGAEADAPKSQSENSTKEYTLAQFMSAGVVNWHDYKFTYYSQSVLPGAGLAIPGRHLNEDGYVVDQDGYLVLAGSAPKGTVYETPFGAAGKVYDRGTVGNHLDVYIR